MEILLAQFFVGDIKFYVVTAFHAKIIYIRYEKLKVIGTLEIHSR